MPLSIPLNGILNPEEDAQKERPVEGGLPPVAHEPRSVLKSKQQSRIMQGDVAQELQAGFA